MLSAMTSLQWAMIWAAAALGLFAIRALQVGRDVLIYNLDEEALERYPAFAEAFGAFFKSERLWLYVILRRGPPCAGGRAPQICALKPTLRALIAAPHGQMTVFTGPERRRRWSEDDRQRVLAAAFSPGAVVTEVARRFDVSTALIYRWRQEARGLAVGFAPVVLTPEPMARPAPAEGAGIVVDLADASRVSIGAGVSPALAAAALRALRP